MYTNANYTCKREQRIKRKKRAEAVKGVCDEI